MSHCHGYFNPRIPFPFASIQQSITMISTSRRWAPSEDEKLRLLVQRYGDQRGHNSKWCEISQGLPGRTTKVNDLA